MAKFGITDWGPISSFLGINMHYDVAAGVLEMDVIEKVKELFSRHGILNNNSNIKTRATPLDHDYSHIAVEEECEIDNSYVGLGKTKSTHWVAPPIDTAKLNPVEQYIVEHFAAIVGSLIYISITARPDLAFAIGKLSRGMHQPNLRHVKMMVHVLGYLRKTQYLKLVYKRTGNAVQSLFRDLGAVDASLASLCGSDHQNIDPLGGFSDANHANKSDEQMKSISGYCFFLFGMLVSWRSKLQTITATRQG